MKRTSRILAAAAALALSGTTVATAATFAQGNGDSNRPTECVRTVSAADRATPAAAKLTAQQRFDLAYSREEERMARDLYKAFADKYDGARPFSNITKSEQRHYDAVGRMLTRYDLADPSAGKAAGDYAYPTLTKNYAAWLKQGQKSQIEANKAGVALEKADIATLEASLKQNLPSDIKQVYTNLLDGSRNHLAAFTRAADGKAVGQGAGQGKGQGKGQGAGQAVRQGNGQGAGQGRGARDGSGGRTCDGTCDGTGQGKRDGTGQGKRDGTGQGKRDGTGPRAGTAECPKAA